jgi:site-specific DNA recombinase
MNPGEVIDMLAAKLACKTPEVLPIRRTPEQISQTLAEKQQERNLILTLYRRGRIAEQSVEEQLNQIEAEEQSLRSEREQTALDRENATKMSRTILSVQELLQQLGARLEQGISWELKRQLVEALVDGVEIDTIENQSVRETVVSVRYRFNPFSSDCTGTDSLRRRASDGPGM